MKKVLIGLLVLAVAGGGVFAQEWQFNGEIRTGLGMFFLEDDDDPRLGIVTDDPGANRADLRARVQNADGTAGIDILFRAEGGAIDGFGDLDEDLYYIGIDIDLPSFPGNPVVTLPHAFGWLNFMDNMLTLQGGRIDDAAGFNSFDRMAGARMGEGTGLRLLVRPMDGLVLNFGVYADPNHNFMWFGYEEGSRGQARTVFAVRYEEPDLFRVVAGARTANEAPGPAGGFHGWVAGGSSVRDGDPSAAYLSFEYLGLSGDGIHIAASAFFLNLEEFGDDGYLFFYGSFGHNALVDGMDLTAGVGFGLSQNDADDDFYLWIWGSVSYQLSDSIVPRLDLHYVMGGRSDRSLGSMHHRNVARGGATFDSDDSFVRIQPSVQFRVQANTFFELGCIFHIDIGDNATWGNGNGTNIAAYALMRVSF